MEWISVKDKLPEKNDYYLVFPEPNIEHNIVISEYEPWANRWKHDEYDGYGWTDIVDTPTHWMPLPEPPKEKDK